MSHIIQAIFQHCRWDNPIAKWGSLFFSIFAFSIIWFYVDKFQQASQTQEVAKQPTATIKGGVPSQKSQVQTRSQAKASAAQVAAAAVESPEESKNAELLAERRAKKRDLLMKMTAPDRIDEDPLLEEQQATGRDSPKKQPQTAGQQPTQVVPIKVEEVKQSHPKLETDDKPANKKKQKKTKPTTVEIQEKVIEEVKVNEVKQKEKIEESTVVVENDEWNVVDSKKRK